MDGWIILKDSTGTIQLSLDLSQDFLDRICSFFLRGKIALRVYDTLKNRSMKLLNMQQDGYYCELKPDNQIIFSDNQKSNNQVLNLNKVVYLVIMSGLQKMYKINEYNFYTTYTF